MEVLRLCKIIVVPKAPFNLIRNVKLGMEIIVVKSIHRHKAKIRQEHRFDLISLY
jgi:hypothetical protein